MCFNLLLHGRKVHYVVFISFFIGVTVGSTVLPLINVTSHMLNSQNKVYRNNINDNSLRSTAMGTVTFSCVRHGILCGILQSLCSPCMCFQLNNMANCFANTPSND